MSKINKLAKSLTTISDYQVFINENKITSAQDFKERFYTPYYKMISLGFAKEIVYYGKSISKGEEIRIRNQVLDQYNTLEDFQLLIDQKEFKKAEDLRKFDERLYRKLCKLGFHHKVIFKGSFENWTFDTFQNFIYENKIENPVDFYTRFKKVYSAAVIKKQNIPARLIYSNRLNIQWDQKSAFKAVIDRCEDNGYIFLNKDTWEYKGALEVNIEVKCPLHNHTWKTSFNSFVKSKHGCKICSIGYSKMEEMILDLLQSLNIDFEVQKHFEYLGMKSLDFYLFILGIALECQGDQHFIPVDWFGGEEGFGLQKNRDLEKYKLLKEHNIEIIYYADPSLMHSRYKDEILNNRIPNYFAKVYTNLEDIKELLKTKIKNLPGS